MKSRIPILFLTLLLFLTVFGAGTAAADTQFEDYFDDQNKQILGYNETIYINGDTVTIVNNFESSGFPVRKFNDTTYSSTSAIPPEFNYYIDEENQTTVVQFNISELGLNLTKNDEEFEEFTLYLCGNIGGDYNNKHVDSEIRFRVEKIFEEIEEPENGGEDNPVIPAYEIIVYPIQSSFTHDFNKPVYYSANYGSVFTDEAVYLDLKEEFVGKNIIYSFDQGTLRSVYWYDAEADELNLKPDGSMVAYEPEFILNLSDLQDFGLNSLFICPEHDTYTVSDYNDASKTLTIDGIPYSGCTSEFEWALTIGDSEKNASDYLMTYDDLYPVEKEDGNPEETPDPEEDDGEPEEEEEVDIITYPHFISFNSSALSGDLSKTRTQAIQFYPVLKTGNEIEQQPEEPGESDPSLPGEEDNEDEGSFTSFKDKAYTFKFSRLYTSVPIELKGDTMELVSETTDYSKPLVSSLSFPEAVKDALKDNSLILESLNSHALDKDNIDDDSGYLTPETSVLSVTDISFENSINDVLKENNETVELSFVIPTVIDDVDINPNEITVLHISEGEEKSLEKLETTVRLKDVNGVKYYAVTAKTSGFSPFAVVSNENNGSENVSKAGGQSYGEAVVIPSEEDVPPEDKNGYNNVLPPLTTIEDIITKVQGHLSVFSVLVVLTSGLFMWNYIRRRI